MTKYGALTIDEIQKLSTLSKHKRIHETNEKYGCKEQSLFPFIPIAILDILNFCE